jgi:hypothetical protein
MSTYATDDDGKIPKKNDHAIDSLRYLMNAAHLSTVPRERHKRPDDRREWTNIDYLEDNEVIEEPIDFNDDFTEEWYE